MGAPRAISVFSGAGGLDYGLEAAGFETSATLELDKDCCSTLRKSRPHWAVIERSVFDVATAELLEVAGVRPGDLELLVGGPPCQPFSKSGYWSSGDARRLEDPRASTISAYLRIVEEARPRALLLENVEGLAYAGKDEGLRLILDQLRRINKRTKSNYVPEFRVVNAAAYGVPQVRERVILVASRDGRRFSFPAPTFTAPAADVDDPGLNVLAAHSYRTAWDAIGDLQPTNDEDLEVRGKWADLLPSIPEGLNYLHHTDRGRGVPLFGWRRRYWSFLLKLAKSRPSWTIQAQPGPSVGPFHWENRRLSIREMCRIQTFPDDVEVVGARTSAQRQVGNAVPSLLGEVLGRAIRAQLLDSEAMRGPLRLLPSLREPVPEPEAAAPVASRYRRLIGRHSPHPGTGRGFGAQERASLQL